MSIYTRYIVISRLKTFALLHIKMKWLCPLSLPLTCVFSDTGTLIDLIPGATKETFLYTTEAISDMKITNYHYPNRFKIPKYNVIHLLNQVLKCKMDLNRGMCESAK